jgi:ABC-type dipeptide/oligopeptide/nickel transport system ATPase component
MHSSSWWVKSVQDLFRTPTHPYTKALLASVLTPDPALRIPDVGLGDAYPDPHQYPAGLSFPPALPERVGEMRGNDARQHSQELSFCRRGWSPQPY